MADELSDRIYMIAGGSNTNRRKLCRYYTVSSNSWGDCGSLQNKTIVSRLGVDTHITSQRQQQIPYLYYSNRLQVYEIYRQDCAAVIVAAKHNQRRYIAVHGYSWEKEKAVHYMYLDNFGVWGTMVNAIYDYQFVFGVSLTKWEAYLMGGKSNQHGASTR